MSNKEQPTFQQWTDQYVSDNMHKLKVPQLVQDRRPGESYNPKASFDQLMNRPEIMDMLTRLSVK